MNEEHFYEIADVLTEYLETKKMFVPNPKRMKEVNTATEMACRLFPEAEINLKDDPLQMGAIILEIEDCFIVVREIEKFVKLIGKANNFDIFSGDDGVRLSILFANALIRI